MGTDNINNKQPKYIALAESLEVAIREGIYRAGDKLPSIRVLSKQTGAAKNTVISALQTLEQKSLVVAKDKSGYFVKAQVISESPSVPEFKEIKPTKIAIPDLLQDVIAKGAAFDLKPGSEQAPEPVLMSKLHRQIYNAMRQNKDRQSLYYDDPLGQKSLREQIALRYASIDVNLRAADLCMTAGCQHGLLLALMATCQPGDNVVIESPGFYGVIQLLDELGLNGIEVPCHSISGLDINILEHLLSRYKIKACVVTPAFSTPTGACMPDEGKKRLVALAHQHDFALIEDDIYGDLGFYFRPKPLKYFDNNECVILCSSFSKSLSRDLRIGWIAGARWQKKIQRLKLITHLANSPSVQQGVAEFMASGNYSRLIKSRVHQLELQRNDLIHCLSSLFGYSCRFTQPIGGLCLWFELTNIKDTLLLYRQCLKEAIILTPGPLFSAQNDFSRFLRLSFCHPLTTERKNALQLIASLTR